MRTIQNATQPLAAPPERSRAPGPLAWAWVGVVLIPVFFIIALGVGEGVTSLLGYTAGAGDNPVWVTLVADLAAVVAFVLPCLAAVFFGRRAYKSGDRRGLVPALLGAVAGVGLLILTVVSELGDLLR